MPSIWKCLPELVRVHVETLRASSSPRPHQPFNIADGHVPAVFHLECVWEKSILRDPFVSGIFVVFEEGSGFPGRFAAFPRATSDEGERDGTTNRIFLALALGARDCRRFTSRGALSVNQ